jgi:hypothetical protein
LQETKNASLKDMNREYSITIKSGKNAPQIADNVLKEFRCSISEPSAWLAPGTTTERGLTFLDKKGNTLVSSLFKHQAYFHRPEQGTVSEKAEIEELIYATITEHYHLVRADIDVKVSEVGKL